MLRDSVARSEKDRFVRVLGRDRVVVPPPVGFCLEEDALVCPDDLTHFTVKFVFGGVVPDFSAVAAIP